MLEDIEDAELHGLTVLLAEALQILSYSHLGSFLGELRVRLGLATKLRIRDREPLEKCTKSWG